MTLVEVQVKWWVIFRSLWSRQFLNVANERTCFASCACAFKSSGLITRLECTSALQQNRAQLRLLYLLTDETQYYKLIKNIIFFSGDILQWRGIPPFLYKRLVRRFLHGLLSFMTSVRILTIKIKPYERAWISVVIVKKSIEHLKNEATTRWLLYAKTSHQASFLGLVHYVLPITIIGEDRRESLGLIWFRD